jgi:hypothetical protein
LGIYSSGPSCSDGIQNQDEEDVDCGGPCPACAVWNCNENYYGTSDGCDCGCGIPDPDCGINGCTTPECYDASCEYCYDENGNDVTCPDEPCLDTCQSTGSECGTVCGVNCGSCVPEWVCIEGVCEEGADSWLCNPDYYGDGDCDCGCGIPDIDCPGGGCTFTGCSNPECDYCFAENTGNSIGCS